MARGRLDGPGSPLNDDPARNARMLSSPTDERSNDRISSPRGGGLAVYVTSHGFGHLNRTAAVLNRMPPTSGCRSGRTRTSSTTGGERVNRPIELEAHVSDAGAVNPPGDSAATDGPATLELAAQIHAEAMARLDDEVDWLRDAGDRRGALRRARPSPWWPPGGREIPGFLMANFTWADIYAPHARPSGVMHLAWSPSLRGLSAGHRPVPDPSRPCGWPAEAGDRCRHGRQPGARPPRRAA